MYFAKKKYGDDIADDLLSAQLAVCESRIGNK